MKFLKLLLVVFLGLYVGSILYAAPAPRSSTGLVFAVSAVTPLLIRILMRGASSATIIAFFATPVVLVLACFFPGRGEFQGWFPIVAAFALAFGFPVWTILCILMHREEEPKRDGD